MVCVAAFVVACTVAVMIQMLIAFARTIRGDVDSMDDWE